MTRFERALKFVLAFEGGLADHPADPGGRTMRGVTQATYDSFRHKRNLPLQDVALITTDEIKAIYYNLYWLKAGCDKLPDGLDLVVFDTAVGSGPDRAIKTLQKTLYVDADGIIGPITRGAIDSIKDVADTVNRFMDIRIDFLNLIVEQKPQLKVFIKGWLRRMESLESNALGDVS